MSTTGGVRLGAIVGYGNVAANGHLPAWNAAPDFAITAVVDPDETRRSLAEEALPGIATYADLAALHRAQRVDFLDVASPPAFHAPAILSAAEHGVHVLCEKPLTTSLDEYRRLRQAVQKAGVVLHTVHNWKYAEAFRVTRTLVNEGRIGTLRSICFDTARNGCSVSTGENWRVDAGVAGGGILVDHGWHAFYLMLGFACDVPQRVHASMERRRFVEATVEDTVDCVFEFATMKGEIHLTWAADERRTQWRLVGDDGELVVDDDRVVLRSNEGSETLRLGAALSAGSHHADWFEGVVDEFRQALDDPQVARANENEAAVCVSMLSMAYESAGRGGIPMTIPALDSDRAGTVAA